MSVQQLDGVLLLSDNYYEYSSTSMSRYIVLNGDTFRVMNQRTIVNSNDTGYQGEICYDSNYMYVCVSDNLWKRLALKVW
jgi:hypothetical protein